MGQRTGPIHVVDRVERALHGARKLLNGSRVLPDTRALTKCAGPKFTPWDRDQRFVSAQRVRCANQAELKIGVSQVPAWDHALLLWTKFAR
jgi:hypothetical protein